MKQVSKYVVYIFFFSLIICSCKKLVEIDPPATTIVTEQAFQDSANASSAISGIYGNMVNNGLGFMSGGLTITLGKSADELVPLGTSGDKTYSNSLVGTDGETSTDYWVSAYTFIYQANACIEGLQASTGIHDNIKSQFTAEAKFMRALCYFYMVNLFVDVPMPLTTDFHKNETLPATPKAEIYAQILNDLQEAKDVLPADYSISNNDRVRANKWAATALLARVYLYQNDWINADKESTEIISNSSLFGLTGLDSIFLSDPNINNEAILQWQLNTQVGSLNSTPEAANIIPYAPPDNYPRIYLNDLLLKSFEPGDRRREAWLDSVVFSFNLPDFAYYYPFKYKIGISDAQPGVPPTENVSILRLAEQYLIRAEARAQQGNSGDAVKDLNMIRERAGLPDLDPSLDQQQTLAAVAQERRIELFAEWGHRWLDLKRTGQIDAVMSVATPLKGQNTEWQSFQQLYPIPRGEILNDPNLKQNPGY